MGIVVGQVNITTINVLLTAKKYSHNAGWRQHQQGQNFIGADLTTFKSCQILSEKN
jgi:hypothetical protein